MERPLLRLARSGHFADERLPLELIRREPQVPFPLHTHEFSELVIILSGSGVHFTESDQQTVSAGDVFVVEGRSAHGYRGVSDLALVNILFDPLRLRVPPADLRAIPGYRTPTRLNAEPAAGRSVPFRLGGAQLARAARLVDELEEECREKRPGYHSLATGRFLEIVGYLARCASDAAGRAGGGLADAVGFFERNVERRIHLEELVALTGMSESSLLRAFKAELGVTPKQYHLQLRIARACELLSRSALSITEISYRSGFSDSNYFSRQFRKVMHLSPRQYRREAGAGGAVEPRRP